MKAMEDLTILLSKYKYRGEFIFRSGDKLSKLCKDVPNEVGVYIISVLKEDLEEVVYLDASGRMYKNGAFGKQKLHKRLQNMQNSKTRRQDYYDQELAYCDYDGIRVRWYLTFVDEHRDLPMYVEALLLQTYFIQYEKLPKWNSYA